MTIDGFKEQIRKIGYRSKATSDNLNTTFSDIDQNFKALKDYITALESRINMDFDAQLGPSYVVPEKIHPTNTLNGFTKRNGTTEGFGYYKNAEGIKGKTYFYSSIIGRKPMINPALGCFMGMRTFNCDSLQLMDDEHGPNGEKVYAVDGRDWMRMIGNEAASYNDQHGGRIGGSSNTKLEFVNLFDALNLGTYVVSNDPKFKLFENGQYLNTFDHSTNIASPLNERFIDACSPVSIPLRIKNGINTVLLENTGSNLATFKIELGVSSNKIIIPKQKAIIKGINQIEIPYTELDYHPGASQWDIGSDFGNGGKVSVFVHPDTLQIRVGTNWIPKYAKSCGYKDINADHSFQPSFRHEPITLTSELTEETGLTDYDTIACHTSNVGETGTVSASIEDGTNHSWHAFNKDTKTKTKTYTFLQSNNPYLTYEYFVTQKHLSGYSITSGNFGTDRMPTAWLVELYNIETQKWEQVDSQTSQLFGSAYTTKKYALSSTKEFSKIRIQFTQNGGATTTDVQEVQFFTSVKRVRPMFDLVEKHYGYTGTSGVVSASSYEAAGEYFPWRPFNKKCQTWITSKGSRTGYLVYKFNIAQKVTQYSLQTQQSPYTDRAPKNFTIQGSNNGKFSHNGGILNSDYWILDSRENIMSWSSHEKRSFIVSTPSTYIHYKLEITENNGSTTYTGLCAVEFYSDKKQVEPFFENEELVKAFNVREFGNGGKNTGTTTSTSPEDISVAGGSEFTSGFTLDDGCTNLCAVLNYGHDATCNVIYPRSGGKIAFTGYFSGVSLKNTYPDKAYVNGDLISNMPMGTHIVEIQRISGTETKIYIDGVLILSTNNFHFHILGNFTFYQPKSIELPEGALILGEYMLNANASPCIVPGLNTIGKGVRREYSDRNIFYDDSGSGGTASWKLSAPRPDRIGSREAVSNRGHKEFRYPFRGTGIGLRWTSGPNRSQTNLFELSKDGGQTFIPVSTANLTSKFGGATLFSDKDRFNSNGMFSQHNAVSDIDGAVAGITGLPLGNYILKVSNSIAGASDYLLLDCLEVETPIHRANHYQEWETPHLYELVGGGDGLDNQNLLVSSKSETLDKLNRPDIPYRGEIAWAFGRDAGHMNEGLAVFNVLRGTHNVTSYVGTAKCKGVILLNSSRILIKEGGQYHVKGVFYNSSAGGGGKYADIRTNDNEVLARDHHYNAQNNCNPTGTFFLSAEQQLYAQLVQSGEKTWYASAPFTHFGIFGRLIREK